MVELVDLAETDCKTVLTGVATHVKNLHQTAVEDVVFKLVETSKLTPNVAFGCKDGKTLFEILLSGNEGACKLALELICNEKAHEDIRNAVNRIVAEIRYSKVPRTPIQPTQGQELVDSEPLISDCNQETKETVIEIPETGHSQSHSFRIKVIEKSKKMKIVLMIIIMALPRLCIISTLSTAATFVVSELHKNHNEPSTSTVNPNSNQPNNVSSTKDAATNSIPNYDSAVTIVHDRGRLMHTKSSTPRPTPYSHPPDIVILRGQEDKELEKLKNVFKSPSYPMFFQDSLRDASFLKNKLCNESMEKGLNLSMEKTHDPNDTRFGIPCPHKINGAEFSGKVSVSLLAHSLSHLSSIKYLHIDAGEFVEEEEDAEEEEEEELAAHKSHKQVQLSNLEHIKLSNISKESPTLLHHLSNDVGAENVKTLVFSHALIQITNLAYFEEIIGKFPKLESLSFEGTLCPNCELFKEKRFPIALNNLRFMIANNTESSVSAENSLRNLALESTRSLKSLMTNVPQIPSAVSRFIHLVLMTVPLQLAHLPTFNLQALVKFPYLLEANLTLNFNGSYPVRVTNVQAYFERARVRNLSLRVPSIRVEKRLKGWEAKCRSFEHYVVNGTYVWGEQYSIGESTTNKCNEYWGVR